MNSNQIYINGTAAGRIMHSLLEERLSSKSLNPDNLHWFRDEILSPETTWNHHTYTKLRHWAELGESNRKSLSFFLYRYLMILPPKVVTELTGFTYEKAETFIPEARKTALIQGKSLLKKIEWYLFFTGGKESYIKEILQRKDKKKLLRKQTKAMVFICRQKLLIPYGVIAKHFKVSPGQVARKVFEIEDYLTSL